MLKRGHPFTPEPALINKKNREHQPPLARTPLRNVVRDNKTMAASSASPATSLNDDIDEKRQHRKALVDRRKQLKKTIMSPATVTPNANPSAVLTPRRATPLTPNASLLNPKTVITQGPAVTIAPRLTLEQRNKMFEEWMKIAADNKINAKNSWNVALIDYFSELVFVQEGDSINFQKASCTLDGCVKIYSTRVDAVVDETGRLLNGLVDGKHFDSTEDDHNATIDHQQSTSGAVKRLVSSKRPHKAVDTLSPSFEQLTMKNFELEFAIDPLFKRMCAEFDDNTASKGLLTSRLAISDEGRLLFDSMDADSRDNGNFVNSSTKENLSPDNNNKEDEIFIDSNNLLEKFGRQLDSLDEKLLSPTLNGYSTKSTDFNKLDQRVAETMNQLAAIAVSVDQMDVESDDGSVNGEDMAGFGADDNYYDTVPFDGGDFGGYEPGLSANSNDFKTNTMQSKYETKEEGVGFSLDSNESFYAYFDSKMQRNWAGPEHWKIQRPHLQRTLPTTDGGMVANKSSRSAKKDFVIDFEAESIDYASIFVKANPITITLTKSALDQCNEQDNMLPEDLHFSSRTLLQLFIKPAWTVGKRTTVKTTWKTVTNNFYDANAHHDNDNIRDTQSLDNGEIATAYWAEKHADDNDHGNANTDIVPFNDDYDDANVNDNNGYDDDDNETLLLDLPTQSTQTVSIGDSLVPIARPTIATALNYARKAKNVDVQELKRVLWNEIDTATIHNNNNNGNDSNNNNSSNNSDQSKTTTFTELINVLPSTELSKDTLKDVSISYCFICLLHLANEHNLDITAQGDNDVLVSHLN